MMEWIEIIQVRPYAEREMEKAVWTFRQLSRVNNENGLKKISLLRGVTIESELSLSLFWKSRLPRNGKSVLGRQLAEIFSEFGQIHHSGWIEMNGQNSKKRRKINAQQQIL